jgi:hypothetical protein
MKVIKVGTSAQSRIAQACDRCRSKKIRCDGIRPCCTQCANVGFECKTSDKLSRRAFPRGYTESLEDRVRSLEAEVRELKELLDEKDEKIDLLSRIHSFSPASRKSSTTLSSGACEEIKATLQASKDDTFHVEQPSPVSDKDKQDGNVLGASSTYAFISKGAIHRHILGTNLTCQIPSNKKFNKAASHLLTLNLPPSSRTHCRLRLHLRLTQHPNYHPVSSQIN